MCHTQLEMNKKYTRRAVCRQAEGGRLGDWGLLSFLYFPLSSTMYRYYFYNHETVLPKHSFPSLCFRLQGPEVGWVGSRDQR